MTRLPSLAILATALAIGTPAWADTASQDMAPAAGTPVKLVEFDGGWELLKTSSQLRVWRSNLDYSIAVDADGKATDCAITDEFRRAYVNKKLCSVLVKSHTFEPARDATNMPVAGTYTGSVSYMDLRARF